MIELAVGDFFRVDYEAMRDWGDARAGRRATSSASRPLAAASTAVLALAAAFTGAVPEGDGRTAPRRRRWSTRCPTRSSARRLDALAYLATAELYLDRYDDAGAHAERGARDRAARPARARSPPSSSRRSARPARRRGRLAEAAALLDAAVEAARLAGNTQALGWILLQPRVHRARGRRPASRRSTPPRRASSSRATSTTAWSPPRRRRARARARRGGDEPARASRSS